MHRLVKIGRFVKRGFLKILPITVFFIVGLNLIAVSKHLVLAEPGVVYEGLATATLGALLIAKIVVVVDKLPIMRFFGGRPLYQTILLRAIFYSLCVFAFRWVEMLIGHWIEAGDFSAGLGSAQTMLLWNHVVFLQIWTIVLFLVYLTVTELLDAVGDESRLQTLFLRRSRQRVAKHEQG
ncbi:MAG: hypothetical protein AAFX92_00235 [Pseudomonadota bacterium]